MVLIGNSLGSGVATELATRHSVRGLVLVSGFSSLADVAALHVRLFPVRLLLRDRYNNQAKLPRVRAPVLILHGAKDSLIPAAQGVELAKAANGASLAIVPDAGHELAYLPQAQRAILSWLGGR
jgi:pimeloyl-ACP methyl ester carboxylesterase